MLRVYWKPSIRRHQINIALVLVPEIHRLLLEKFSGQWKLKKIYKSLKRMMCANDISFIGLNHIVISSD